MEHQVFFLTLAESHHLDKKLIPVLTAAANKGEPYLLGLVRDEQWPLPPLNHKNISV